MNHPPLEPLFHLVHADGHQNLHLLLRLLCQLDKNFSETSYYVQQAHELRIEGDEAVLVFAREQTMYALGILNNPVHFRNVIHCASLVVGRSLNSAGVLFV